MLKNRFYKRLLTFIMTVVMTVSLVPMQAFAASNQVVEVGTRNKTPGNPASGISAKDKVFLSKTINQVNEGGVGLVENVFDITLEVRTTEEMSNISVSKDAAVVFVMDISNSMEDNYVKINGQTMTRLAAARLSAKNFLDKFVEDRGEGDRYMSIVKFNNNATTVTDFSLVNTTTEQNAMKGRIDTVTLDADYYVGGTNIEAGLLLANNLVAKFKTTNSTVDNLYVILMTDGEPTTGLSNISNTSVTNINGDKGNGTSTPPEVYDNLISTTNSNNVAYQIKNVQGATLYAVPFASKDTKVYKK